MPATPTSSGSSSTAPSAGDRRGRMMSAAGPKVRVYLEVGRASAFAVALDWPGWCRRAKTPEAALAALDTYRHRFAAVVGEDVPDLPFEVVGTVDGNRTTDFGAPDAQGPWDAEPLTGEELARQVDLLEDAWAYFDLVVASAPAELRKGPRGGGRHRDGIVAHVMEAERAYCPKVGTRVPPRTPWDAQRAVVLAALRSGADGGTWPVGYALRRLAWHVLDHAWEIEDKSD